MEINRKEWLVKFKEYWNAYISGLNDPKNAADITGKDRAENKMLNVIERFIGSCENWINYLSETGQKEKMEEFQGLLRELEWYKDQAPIEHDMACEKR